MGIKLLLNLNEGIELHLPIPDQEEDRSGQGFFLLEIHMPGGSFASSVSVLLFKYISAG
jgi:hypothetical protein